MDPIAQTLDRAQRHIRHAALEPLPAWRRVPMRIARFVLAIHRDLTLGYLTLHAMSLVYTTLLSLVPLLAVSFSVLKGFGVHNQVEPMLLNSLAPLGEKGEEIARRIIEFVDNVNVGVLGSLGLALLIYTVVSLIHKIEQVFNYTWHVERSRPFAQRFSQYLSVLLIGPVLLFSAVGLGASIRATGFVQTMAQVAPLGLVLGYSAKLMPYLLISGAFAFVYLLVPNTRVRLSSALVGALWGGALWQIASWVFSTFMVSSTQYDAIYSSLAILILFMIWLYVGWLILLIGATIAFYHQHPEYLAASRRDLHLGQRLIERIALAAAGRVARRHAAGEPPPTAGALAAEMAVAESQLLKVLEILETGGFLVRSSDEPPCYLLPRAPETIPLAELLTWVRCRDETLQAGQGPAADPTVIELERTLDRALAASLAGRSLRELAGVTTASVAQEAVSRTGR